MKYILLLFMMMGSLFANIGKITSISGKALALRDGNTILLHKGSNLEEKDVIKTMPNTRLQIVFNDHTVISLGQKTTFRVDKYAFNRQNKEARFSVTRGIFKSITGKIGHLNHSKYTLKTNNATIGVRGTIYVGRIERNRESIACTSGEIVVHTRRGSVVVRRGEITTFTPFSKPSKPTKYKKQNLQLFKGVVSKSDVKVVDSVKISQTAPKIAPIHKITKIRQDITQKIIKKPTQEVSKPIQNITEPIQNITQEVNEPVQSVTETTQEVSQEVVQETTQAAQTTIEEVANDFGDFGQENMQESDESSQEVAQNTQPSDSYEQLIQRAGSSQLHYVGKVNGDSIVNDNYNKVDLNFDLGTASVGGKVKFRKEHNYGIMSHTTNWNTNISGHVNENGTFDFDATTNHYSGGGGGELTGEHLEKASGTINISKTAFGRTIANTRATFTATKQ